MSYFTEHDCEDTNSQGEFPDLLHLARMFLLQEDLVDIDFASNVEEVKGPPASKNFVKQLLRKQCSEMKEAIAECPICLEHHKGNITFIELPCSHNFHQDCILPWLNNTNSCPVCRHELPTDDPRYEELRLQKVREKDRLHRIETLHSEMFG